MKLTAGGVTTLVDVVKTGAEDAVVIAGPCISDVIEISTSSQILMGDTRIFQ